MTIETYNTIVIGAGLSGIYAGSLLHQKKESFVVLEARGRIGGRILTPEHHGFLPIWGHPGTGRISIPGWPP